MPSDRPVIAKLARKARNELLRMQAAGARKDADFAQRAEAADRERIAAHATLTTLGAMWDSANTDHTMKISVEANYTSSRLADSITAESVEEDWELDDHYVDASAFIALVDRIYPRKRK